MPWTTSAGSGNGMQVASPPSSKARKRGVSSSQSPSRLVVGRGDGTAEKSGARKGLANWRAMTLCGTTRRVDGARPAAAWGSCTSSGSGSRPPARSRSFLRLTAEGETTTPSASSSSSEVSRTAVLARIVAMPSSRVSTAARSASGVEVSLLTRARSSRTRRATTWYAVRPLGPTLPRCAAASTCRTALARTGMMPSSSPARGRRRSRDVVRDAPGRRGARCAKRFLLLSRTRRGAEVGPGPPCWRRRGRRAGSTAYRTDANACQGPSPGPGVAEASSPNDGTQGKAYVVQHGDGARVRAVPPQRISAAPTPGPSGHPAGGRSGPAANHGTTSRWRVSPTRRGRARSARRSRASRTFSSRPARAEGPG